jgi:hypothetical protein
MNKLENQLSAYNNGGDENEDIDQD